MFQKLEKLLIKYQELETLLADPDLVKDQQKYQSAAKEYASLGLLVHLYRQYQKTESELKEVETLLKSESADEAMQELYVEEEKSMREKLQELRSELESLLLAEDDPYKDRNIIMEIRAGTGGEEAALFASVLFRMYCKYAASLGLSIEILSGNDTGIGGLKEIIYSISGKNAYSKFKYESGTHRVQRVPITESSGRIHTSAVTVAVLPEAEEVDVDINPTDLRIDTFRAGGAGGQHVNKTESAIRITHLPTNFVVTCQDEKSQLKNKIKALRVLRTRLLEKMQADQAAKTAADRKQQVGSGDRSERIRTYNYPDQRITDHRIGLTLHSLPRVLEGELEEVVAALQKDERERRLAQE